MKSPIETFTNWVKTGRDEGMEKNHKEPVKKMIELILSSNKQFSIIDAGCGNGWAVRLISSNKNCLVASGVDGSKLMIKKAKKIDKKNKYFHGDLNNWIPKKKVDVVMSMEVFYYFEDPKSLISKIYHEWLNPGGQLVIGLDFYFENPDCHNWQEQTGVSIMKLLKINDWIKLFKKVGFKEVNKYQFCQNKSWMGTLVIQGIKI